MIYKKVDSVEIAGSQRSKSSEALLIYEKSINNAWKIKRENIKVLLSFSNGRP